MRPSSNRSCRLRRLHRFAPNGAQKLQEKLPGASPNGVIRPPGFDKPVNVPPKGLERQPGLERPQGLEQQIRPEPQNLGAPNGLQRPPVGERPPLPVMAPAQQARPHAPKHRSPRATSSGCSPSRAASPFADSRACRRARSEKYKGSASVLPCSSAGRRARLTSRFRRSPRPGAGERCDSPRSRGLRSPRASRSRSTVRELSC